MSLDRLTNEEKVKQALEQGERLRKSKQYEAGIDLLIEALKYGIEKDQIYFHLGNIYHDSGDLERAEYAYKKVIDNDPNHINAYHNLAVVYRKQGRIGESIKMRKRASALARKNPQRIKLSKDQVERARRFARRVLIFSAMLLALIILLFFLLRKF